MRVESVEKMYRQVLLAALGAEAGEATDLGWQVLSGKKCVSHGPYKSHGFSWAPT